MANKKMTKVEMFEEILKNEGLTVEQKEFITKEIGLLKKKNSHTGKADKAKAELNKKVKDLIVEVVGETEKGATTTDIANAISELMEKSITSQRVAPLAKELVTDEVITFEVIKGRKIYKVVG